LKLISYRFFYLHKSGNFQICGNRVFVEIGYLKKIEYLYLIFNNTKMSVSMNFETIWSQLSAIANVIESLPADAQKGMYIKHLDTIALSTKCRIAASQPEFARLVDEFLANLFITTRATAEDTKDEEKFTDDSKSNTSDTPVERTDEWMTLRDSIVAQLQNERPLVAGEGWGDYEDRLEVEASTIADDRLRPAAPVYPTRAVACPPAQMSYAQCRLVGFPNLPSRHVPQKAPQQPRHVPQKAPQQPRHVPQKAPQQPSHVHHQAPQQASHVHHQAPQQAMEVVVNVKKGTRSCENEWALGPGQCPYINTYSGCSYSHETTSKDSTAPLKWIPVIDNGVSYYTPRSNSVWSFSRQNGLWVCHKGNSPTVVPFEQYQASVRARFTQITQ
jgi:hypothetical protein